MKTRLARVVVDIGNRILGLYDPQRGVVPLGSPNAVTKTVENGVSVFKDGDGNTLNLVSSQVKTTTGGIDLHEIQLSPTQLLVIGTDAPQDNDNRPDGTIYIQNS